MTATCPHETSAAGDSIPVHGPVIRYMRIQREISIGELAELMGVSESYISRFERGTSVAISLSRFRELRLALGLEHEDSRLLMANPYAHVEAYPDE